MYLGSDNYYNFACVCHHSEFEIKQSKCDLSVDLQKR